MQPISTSAGPRAAFDEFFHDHYLPLAKAMYLVTGDRADGEDVAQEAMARVYERWDRVARMESPSGYLYRTAINLQRKRVRSSRRQRPLPLPTGVPDPAETVDRRERIRAAIGALTAEQREALILVEFLGLDSTQAAAALGTSSESVRARLHRARTTLRDQFGGSDV